MHFKTARKNQIILSLGANAPGLFGEPLEALLKAIEHLGEAGLRVTYSTSYIHTRAWGGRARRQFVNSLVIAQGPISLVSCLNDLKSIERLAGRRPGLSKWTDRPLDIDIIDFGGKVLSWPTGSRQHERIILPHPRAHQRMFVLAPLMEAAPDWVHPVYGLTPQQLIRRLPGQERLSLIGAHGRALEACTKIFGAKAFEVYATR